MGIGVPNNEFTADRQTGSSVTIFRFRLHYGNGNVDNPSPDMTAAQAATLKSKAGNAVQFGAAVRAISTAMETWWDACTSDEKTSLRLAVGDLP